MKKIIAVLIIVSCLMTTVGICSDMGEPDPPKGMAPIWYTLVK